jgi:multidrug efflux pump subunit AcrA (membrane-fusion protein)
MFVIEDTQIMDISAFVAEYDVIKIEAGMKAHITSNATGEQVYDGVVDFVAPVASDTSGNFEVKVLLTSKAGQLKPGMTATIEIVTESETDVFAVPIDAVVTLQDGRKAIYVYEPGGSGGGGPMVFVSPGNAGPAAGGDNRGGPGGGSVPGGEPRGVNTVGSRGMAIGPGTGGRPDAAVGAGAADMSNWREIVVQTGMETDYYIEIISDELVEGLLIVADPMGRSVRGSGGMMMFGGPTTSYAEESVTIVGVD